MFLFLGPFDLLAEPSASFAASHSRGLYTLPECIPVLRCSNNSSSNTSNSSSNEALSPLYCLFRDAEGEIPLCVVYNNPRVSGVQTPYAAINLKTRPKTLKNNNTTTPPLPLLFAAVIRHAVETDQGALKGGTQGAPRQKGAKGKQAVLSKEAE